MKLDEHDHVVGAWAEAPSGPGWSNRVVWLCIRSALDGRHRVEALQPEEHGPNIPGAWRMYLAASDSLMADVRALMLTQTKPRASRPQRERGRR
jgi:hypothetical protein